MSRVYLLPEKGRFYKANLHCHTTLSDGELTAEEMKTLYKDHGYSIIAYTDHRIWAWHKELTEPEFLPLAAFEADINEEYTSAEEYETIKTYHINFYDRNPQLRERKTYTVPSPQCGYHDMQGVNHYIEKMKEEGFIACFNHPYWSLQNYDDYRELKGLFAMEIFNFGCEHEGLYGYSPQSYDEMLRSGQRIFCLASDDNHNRFPAEDPLSDSFGGYTMIKTEALDYASVMEALELGNFYYSMGPEIHDLYVEDGKLHIKTSPVEKIYVVQAGRKCYKKVAPKGETVDAAVFELTGREGYIRVVCQDREGKHCGSNARFLDEIML